jgi:hypothetical protein
MGSEPRKPTACLDQPFWNGFGLPSKINTHPSVLARSSPYHPTSGHWDSDRSAPETRGEFFRISVPIGALITGLARSVASTQRGRAEWEARDEVAKAVEDFRKAQAQ